eukprot:m.65522 g.65522  ORF g.65522 m.65522 type:complete len:1076 (-) comp11741_c0_seq2:29-3256(-)
MPPVQYFLPFVWELILKPNCLKSATYVEMLTSLVSKGMCRAISIRTLQWTYCCRKMSTEGTHEKVKKILASKSQVRYNPNNIQMISERIHRKLFPNEKMDSVASMPVDVMKRVDEHLKNFDLDEKFISPLPDTPELELPELLGGDLESHFRTLGERFSQPYLKEAEQFVTTDLPPVPEVWEFSPGWTRYGKDGTIEQVECPLEDIYMFDVEVCVPEGDHPTLATAVSSDAWYGWVSQRLYHYDVTDDEEFREYLGLEGRVRESLPGTRELIRLEPIDGKERKKLVIGHNIGYDRARVLEQYRLKPSSIRFLDTISLHMATSGLSTQQTQPWQRAQKQGAESSTSQPPPSAWNSLLWMQQGSPPSLKQCYKHWCSKELSKDARNTFVEGDMMDIYVDFQNLMSYCSNDCIATFEIYSKAFLHFRQMFPHPVSFSGMLEIGTMYLPVDETWYEYIDNAQLTYDEKTGDFYDILPTYAEYVADQVGRQEFWMQDPWLRHLDWSLPTLEFIPSKFNEDGEIIEDGYLVHLPEEYYLHSKPAWFRELLEEGYEFDNPDVTKYEPNIVDTDDVTPYLLQMVWVDSSTGKEFPLYKHNRYGWGYLVNKGVEHQGIGPFEWKGLNGNFHLEFNYYKLPHKDGLAGQCLSPFSNDYVRFIKNKSLRSVHPDLQYLVVPSDDITYWESNRDRLESQFVVWENDMNPDEPGMRSMDPLCQAQNASEGDPMTLDLLRGVILPPVLVAGTITRRAVEPLWLTATSPKIDKIGSELKTKVTAPPGYKFVGADVDSQELWIAAVLGDGEYGGSHGCTAIGWMTLQGSKSDGTDMHSTSAKIMGVTRDEAKILNYARIYGASQRFAANLLREFNPTMPTDVAQNKAEKLYAATKGVQVERKGTRNSHKAWVGGSESALFNRLEDIAREDMPRTPALGCQISTALQPRFMGGDRSQYIRSRINWVVQSSAVDYLHLMVVCMRHLCEEYDIKARYCISIHDEIRYLVAEEDMYRAAMALQITNMLTRAFFSKRVGITDLPQCVAYFSNVDIDTCLRKEVDSLCITPSNQVPVPFGEALDVYQIGEKCGWTMKK